VRLATIRHVSSETYLGRGGGLGLGNLGLGLSRDLDGARGALGLEEDLLVDAGGDGSVDVVGEGSVLNQMVRARDVLLDRLARRTTLLLEGDDGFLQTNTAVRLAIAGKEVYLDHVLKLGVGRRGSSLGGHLCLFFAGCCFRIATVRNDR